MGDGCGWRGSTLDEWIRAYRRGGFDALVPKPRVVPPRTDVEVLGLAEKLKREQPGRTVAQVRRVMAEAGVAAPSVRSLQRHFVRVGLDRLGPDGQAPRAYGRFEASEPNELWTGDALHGPMVGGRKAYLLAFIDDFSRLLPGYRWGRQAGVPRRFRGGELAPRRVDGQSQHRADESGRRRRERVRQARKRRRRRNGPRVSWREVMRWISQSGVFKSRSARQVALSLKRSAESSHRRKSTPFRSAMSMLNFEINRGGKNLSAERLRVLNQAKVELRKVFHREPG